LRRPIEVVTFDADQTLVDFEAAMNKALGTALAELRRKVPAAAGLSRADLRAIRDEVADELGPAVRMEEVRRAAFQRTLEGLGAPDPPFADELTAIYLEARFREMRLYDDVLPTFALLDDYSLGLVSNGNSYPERVGLARYFKFVLFAHDRGVRKPDSAFYEAVLAAAGCRADELIHVGDSIENDVVAAQALGIRAVWLNRDRKRNVASGAWAEIHSLVDLPDVLARLEP
jgi:FMN hydrolase / 5-amino-6-(5-phospho-D-ribitylamino)uracil phosphatase